MTVDNGVLDDRSARAWLAVSVEPGMPAVARLFEQVGASEAVRALSAGRPVPDVRPVTDPDPAATAAAVLAAGAASGLRWLCPGDEEWPAGLGGLSHAGTLHRRGGVPYGLWVRGDNVLERLCRQAVAVVGARSSTSYGDDTAGDIAAGLGDAGVTVVSGAAYGIDAAAHRGALAVGGATVAVLACGADVVYPRGHDGLLARAVAAGSVVSEAPPGAHPTKVRFLARNRLIAAMTQVVVVVEAGWRSGALNTLAWGNLLHRSCVGVPGPVSSTASAGVHLALREHRADLVTGAAEVREALALIGTEPPAGVSAWNRGELRETDRLGTEQLDVLEVLEVSTGMTVADIAGRTRLPRDAVREVLAMLAGRSLVRCLDDGWRRAVLPRGHGDRTLP